MGCLDDYTFRMTSTTTTISKIKKIRPPPIYITPPLDDYVLHTQARLLLSACPGKMDHWSCDAAATVDARTIPMIANPVVHDREQRRPNGDPRPRAWRIEVSVRKTMEQNPPLAHPARAREREPEVSVRKTTEQHPPLARPPGPRGGPRSNDEALREIQMSGKERHGERGCRVRANASSSYKPMASRDGLQGAVHFTGATSCWTALQTPNEHASPRDAAIVHARALLIYLKHRGVLNVEEFRRTNARSR